jgi:hypothetical protein
MYKFGKGWSAMMEFGGRNFQHALSRMRNPLGSVGYNASDLTTLLRMAIPETQTRTEESTTRKPLRFSSYGFEPRAWERERIHRYSVKRPRWWSLWLTIRELGAKVGIR